MLEYLTDIMEDSQDFGWPSAKWAHAVLLCKMEEDKIQWHETTKIDTVRRDHAQKVGQNSNYHQKKKPNQFHVNTTKKVPVAKQRTTKIMVNCIYMLVPLASPQAKLIPIPPATVVAQKTSRALQSSAKN